MNTPDDADDEQDCEIEGNQDVEEQFGNLSLRSDPAAMALHHWRAEPVVAKVKKRSKRHESKPKRTL